MIMVLVLLVWQFRDRMKSWCKMTIDVLQSAR